MLKKLIVSICIVCHWLILGAQDLTVNHQFLNNFDKYTYLLIQYPKKPCDKLDGATASGFFIRIKNRLFLVTNYHVMTGIDSWKMIIHDYDSIKVRYQDATNNVRYYTINLDSINSKREIFSFLEYPDLYILEINDFPKDAKINSVEKILYGSPKTADTKTAFSFQFSNVPGNDLETQTQQYLNEFYSHSALFPTLNYSSSREKKYKGLTLNPTGYLKNILDTNVLPNKNPLVGKTQERDLFNNRNFILGKDSLENISLDTPWLFNKDLRSPISGSLDSALSINNNTFSLNKSLLGTKTGLSKIPNNSPFIIKGSVDKQAYLIDWLNYDHVSTTFYSGNVVTASSHNEKLTPKLDSLYVILNRKSYHGSSGSPVFFYCEKIAKNKKSVWIEFGGVECAINEKKNSSIIVNRIMLRQRLEQIINQ